MSGPDPGSSDDERTDGGSGPRRGSSDQNGRSPDAPAAGGDESGADVTIEDDGIVRWFLRTDEETIVLARDVVSSVAIVAVIGLLLFAVSGIWPPLVAVESESMVPNMQKGDLIFITDSDRFVGDNPVEGTGVVTLERAQETGYEKFNRPGDVIIFKPDGSEYETPVIHRAHFWVEEGENWVDTKADEEITGGVTCEQVRTCPAPHDGFVTKGDNNDGYDQFGNSVSTVVKPEWVTGKATFRVPWLGHIRLAFDKLFSGTIAPSPTVWDAGLDPASPQLTSGPNGPTAVDGVSAGAGVGAGTGIAAGTAAAAIGRSRR
ncbi:S24/S26 family peptidase [Halopiger aswanensis]|uniref:Signal peptidase n=1 Tax=Halopiger aswanensis TaxID=148449 RepID=A0A3R7HWS9_9EURY|nr:S26 family signal peptidase [Halopiger aswanensis]RKD93732.1 signal peptidase [Halopiger aswanensis]